jgi:ubiquinone/menaquinone biosynthesis C-methylase UbiE
MTTQILASTKPASPFEPTPEREVAFDELPSYASMLAAYHRAHAPELRTMIADLGLNTESYVLDMACGAGPYTGWLAEELGAQGRVVGVDLSAAYLAQAQSAAAQAERAQQISFLSGDIGALPFDDHTFDLVWCAQSLYSLPSPLEALRELHRVTRPGGKVVIFENDVFHQLILPWPPKLELAVRQAQLESLAESAPGAAKFFVGRQLSNVFHLAGFSSCKVTPYSAVRHAPLCPDEQQFITGYLADLRSRAQIYLDPLMQRWFDQLVEPDSPMYMLSRPDFFITYIDLVACGVK